jgi:hypothetical protein
METFVIFFPVTVIVACTWPYRSLTTGPLMVRVETAVGLGVALAAARGLGVAAGRVLGVAVVGVFVGVDEVDAPDEDDTENVLAVLVPEVMAWSMTRAAVVDGIATPTVVKAAGITRPRNERRMVCPFLS